MAHKIQNIQLSSGSAVVIPIGAVKSKKKRSAHSSVMTQTTAIGHSLNSATTVLPVIETSQTLMSQPERLDNNAPLILPTDPVPWNVTHILREESRSSNWLVDFVNGD